MRKIKYIGAVFVLFFVLLPVNSQDLSYYNELDLRNHLENIIYEEAISIYNKAILEIQKLNNKISMYIYLSLCENYMAYQAILEIK